MLTGIHCVSSCAQNLLLMSVHRMMMEKLRLRELIVQGWDLRWSELKALHLGPGWAAGVAWM
jgi:hypothetical protein